MSREVYGVYKNESRRIVVYKGTTAQAIQKFELEYDDIELLAEGGEIRELWDFVDFYLTSNKEDFVRKLQEVKQELIQDLEEVGGTLNTLVVDKG